MEAAEPTHMRVLRGMIVTLLMVAPSASMLSLGYAKLYAARGVAGRGLGAENARP